MKWEFSALEDWNEVWSDEHLEQWTKLLYSSPTSHVFFHPDLVRIWVETYLPLRDFHPIFVWGNSDDNYWCPIKLFLENKKLGLVPFGGISPFWLFWFYHKLL